MKQMIVAFFLAVLGVASLNVATVNAAPFTVEVGNAKSLVQLELDQWGNIIKPRLLFVNDDAPINYTFRLNISTDSVGSSVVASQLLTAEPWLASDVILSPGLDYYWSVDTYDVSSTLQTQSDYRHFKINDYDASVKRKIVFENTDQILSSNLGFVDLIWSNNAVSDNATLSLFANDQAIVEGLNLNSVSDRYSWSLSGVAVGTYLVKALVFDGNEVTEFNCCTFTKQPPLDTTAPVFNLPNNTAFEYENGGPGLAHGALNSWVAAAVAIDNVDGSVTVINNLATLANPLTAGNYTITFSATDSSGNSSSGNRQVTVTEASPVDSIAPIIVVPVNTSFEFSFGTAGLAHSDLVAWLSTAYATDNVDSSVSVSNNLYLFNNPLGAGTYSITFSAQDSSSNAASAVSTVTVSEAPAQDSVKPVVTAPANIIKEYAFGTSGVTHAELQSWIASASATDDVDGNLTVSNTLYMYSNPLLSGTYSVAFTATDTAGNTDSKSATITVNEADEVVVNNPPVINDQSMSVIEGSDLDIVLGPLVDSDNDVLNYAVTGSNDFVTGAAANTIRFNSLTLGLQTLNVTVNDGRGGSDTATISVTVTAEPLLIATNIAYNGWSTMNYTLSGQNTGSSTSPTDEHNPSLYTLVGQMYAANGITGYAHDFAFLPQGSEYIDGTDALDNINTTSATVAVLSAYGSTSGITMDPAAANAENGWVDRMINAAVAAETRGIKPIMFQAWGSSDSSDKFPNAKINTDALQAKHGMLVVRSAEIIDALGQLNAGYIVNSVSPGGKYTPPVTHLYSGDSADTFHGSYAMAYANALATFKCLTGISATDNQFVIPSGGAAGTQYGMSATFIADIISVVDGVQRESLVSGLAEGAAPLANNFERDAEHNVELAINISSAASLLDDVEIVPENFLVKTITASHYSNYSLNNNIFKFTAADAYTGLSDIVFTYTDADNQAIDITMVVNIVPEIVIEPQEIIIGFGLGDWSSFGSSGNLYNHRTTESGQVVNGIRGFNTESTQGNLQDSTGLGVGSITSLTSGNLSGPGFGGNDDPAVNHYGPYTYLYEGLSIAPKGSSVAFSVNGLESDTAYRVNMAGRYPSDNTNIVNVDVNGVLGNFDSNRLNITEYEKVVATDKAGRLVIALSSDGTTAATNWGISYVHINKITDGTIADTPVAPRFIEQPQSLNVTEGANATFSVAVSGTYSLQWYRDDVIINGETASSYTLTTATADNGAVFTVKATNKGGVTESEPAVLTLLTEPPEITQQPLSAVSVMDGNKISLNVVATGAVNYQWKKDGLEIAGENGDKLSMPIAMDDDGAVFTVSVSNPFGSVESNGTVLTVNPLLQQYWFSLGRSDGKASNFTSSFTNFIPGVAAEGGNGEDINFIRGFTESPVNLSGIFRDTTGSVTDLSVSYSSTGSNTDSIAGWGDFNSDIILNANVINELNAKSWADHANLYAYHIYMASGHQVTLEFDNGGLVSGDEWQIQILGLHYQDESRPVDVLLNGNGTSGNMTVGSWDNIAIFDQMVNVDSSGKLQIKIAPQVNANINAIRLIKTGN